jgi:hypothetical protein
MDNPEVRNSSDPYIEYSKKYLEQSIDDRIKMRQVINEVDNLLWHTFKNVTTYNLSLYGSSLNGLALRGDSDLDFSISLPYSDMGDSKILRMIASSIRGSANPYLSKTAIFDSV